jgi:tetratricopeptide (TPR) repeat protein
VWFALIGAGFASLRPQSLKQGVVAAGCVLCLLIIPATWAQCKTWHDPETQWVRVADRLAAEVRASPNSADAHHGLAMVLNALGRQDKALREVPTALSIDPDSSDSHCLLASILDELGRHEDAPVAMTEAVRLDSVSFDARYVLAKIIFRLGQLEALRLRAHSPVAQELLGRIKEAKSSEAGRG